MIETPENKTLVQVVSCSLPELGVMLRCNNPQLRRKTYSAGV
jgi:hypothetical protein